MNKTLLEIRDELAGELKKIQLSGIETSKGWDIFNYFINLNNTIRLVAETIYIGVK